MRVGIITYNYPHLKTEQLVCRYVAKKQIKEVNLYALPFKPRQRRTVIFAHRPDMTQSVTTETLAEFPNVRFQKWDGYQDISLSNDIFIIGGAGILDVGFAQGKPIINLHPGIIPITRGLDAFKWAIFNNQPIGNTLHLIDNDVDKGQILKIRHTPVFSSDNLETLSRRHYENEIDMLAEVLQSIDARVSITEKENPANMRMTKNVEAEMIRNFDTWKSYIISNTNFNSIAY